MYSDRFIVALAVYQKLARFRYSQQMLEVLASLGVAVPAPSTFCERKRQLLGQVVLALKRLRAEARATRQHLDSKKLEVEEFAGAKRTKLSGSHGHDHVHDSTFYGFRLHARVNDAGALCRVLMRPANEHDVSVAPRLLNDLLYVIVTGDKGYISQDLKATVAARAGDIVTPRRSNQLPPSRREKNLCQGHHIVESTFSALDRLGLSDRPYRSTKGFLFHIYITLLAFQLSRLAAFDFWLLLFRIGVK